MTIRLATLVLFVAGAALAQPQSLPPAQDSSGFVAPVATYHPEAHYTDKALKHRREGTVELSVALDAEGQVMNVKETSKKLGDGLDKSAIKTVKTWEFQPAKSQGQSVASRLTVETIFHISPGGSTVASTATAQGRVSKSQPITLASAPAVVYSVGGEVHPPRPVRMPDPPYSERARQKKIRGTVVLSIVIDAAGNVDALYLVKPLDPDLDNNAIETVKTWKFEPATFHGKPVAVQMLVEVTFKLY